MTRHKRISIYITTVFGLVFVMANAAYLPSMAAFVVRVLGVLAAVGLLLATPKPDRPDHPGIGFSRDFWLIDAGEVIVGLGGIVLLNSVLGIHDVSIAWISLVVGVHFFGLYAIWGFPIMIWVGTAITLCGVAGLVAAGMDLSAAAIAVVAGLVPGVVLFTAGWYSVLHRPTAHAIDGK